jgi:hypothetical protein
MDNRNDLIYSILDTMEDLRDQENTTASLKSVYADIPGAFIECIVRFDKEISSLCHICGSKVIDATPLGEPRTCDLCAARGRKKYN